jgi:hypothetical protein
MVFCIHGLITDQQQHARFSVDPFSRLSIGSNISFSQDNEESLMPPRASHPQVSTATSMPQTCYTKTHLSIIIIIISSSNTVDATDTPAGAVSIQLPCSRVPSRRQHERILHCQGVCRRCCPPPARTQQQRVQELCTHTTSHAAPAACCAWRLSAL